MRTPQQLFSLPACGGALWRGLCNPAMIGF
ncbi:MAG: hypothetical protein ACJAVR_002951 [Paracoccaceae bacterium]